MNIYIDPDRNLEIKTKIVNAGNSTIFNDWHEKCGVTKEDFLEGLEWLCATERDDYGRAKRELGCKLGEPKLHRLIRFYFHDGQFNCFYDTESGERWEHMGGFAASFGPDDRI